MQSSNSSNTSGYDASRGTSGTGSFAPVIDQRLKQMEAGAERVVHNETIREQDARRPAQERTEYIEKPAIQQPTQYVTQPRVMEQNVAPIKLKQQEVQQVNQHTVIQEQPVIVKKQEVQVQKEAPVQVTKNTTEHQTLPAIEKKELVVQPVEGTTGSDRMANKTFNQNEYRGDTYASGETDKLTVGERIKQAAHDVKEKVRGAFHPGTTQDETITETKSS